MRYKFSDFSPKFCKISTKATKSKGMKANLSLQSLAFLFLLLIPKCWPLETIKIRKPKNNFYPLNSTHVNVDVYLRKSGVPSNDGIIELKLPFSHKYHAICNPIPNINYNRQVVMFSHIACRQLGFMTYSARYQRSFLNGREPEGVHLNMECMGHEQSFDQCAWSDLRFEYCASVLGTSCSSCHTVLEATEGYITSPGHPYAYLYNLLCEWDIIVPEGNTIHLTFRHFVLPTSRILSLHCDGQPYVETMYGSPGALYIHRYCAQQHKETVVIPRRKVRVLFYSGVYSDNVEGDTNKFGFNIHFYAQPETPPFQPYRVIIIAVCFILFLMMIMSCYCCRKWIPVNSESDHEVDPVTIRNHESRNLPVMVTYHRRLDKSQLNIADKENIPPQRAFSSSSGIGQEAQASCSSDSPYPDVGLFHIHDDAAGRAVSCCMTPHRPRSRNTLARLKTTLFSKFSAGTSNSYAIEPGRGNPEEVPPVMPRVANFHIYNSFESDSPYECPNPGPEYMQFCEIGCNSGSAQARMTSTNDVQLPQRTVNKSGVPKIFVECVDDESSELYELPNSVPKKTLLNPSM